MKTAISIPDQLHQAADRTAERLGWSRSRLYARALEEYLAQHGDDPVTRRLDELFDEVDEDHSEVTTTARELIADGRWTW